MGKRTYIKDKKLLNTTLKKDIKWTPTKIILAALGFLIPYGGFVYYSTSISLIFAGLLIAGPVMAGALYGFIYFVNRDLF
ncbi:hypothetical protein [Arthrospira platensis]|mgnify:CR=1 FL=1|jgi:hypothetical protein|uniref:Uncharacterized protein n=1 Tax=Limnospira platensis NIES-46 TaxID=1236695 RepID=A0A5M3T2X2_LIMPL|nr:hypothetical protein [Arthrospira platensis]AMW27957.1 hypothetical protein AP285_08170 [Arthrospira platensis YZ]KDR54486.1 hypothetical protein APPUASWS_028635 [Arthrospira platensis str. Paraca]MBD2670846.1 hypothetical protein [Arthrospira platensis FACHB-439]MBD2711578.1 hypothetical protein [Arthrospira platensis FACHB-835]MDF2210908.1 hypothetical protein [Arthrospira platensis NCB002]MDT9184194.1 hypothetical protein [Limnospira sp. PMC 289.06]MDT9296390.1 hypothetical protein [Ar